MTLQLELEKGERSLSEEKNNLESLFNPSSVAVVGASIDGEKLGNLILRNLLESGFQGEVYPVNPKAGEGKYIEGLQTYSKLDEIPHKPDVAVVSVPNKIVPSVIEDCGKNGVEFAVVIASGFEETGKEGEDLEEEVRAKATENDVTVLGPNVLGFVDTDTPINASFSPEFPEEGDLAFLSQSGALGSALMEKSRTENIGLSKFVSLGNKTMLDETDFLEYLRRDDRTDYIIMYLEGISRGREFVRESKKISKEKPILAIKSGKTDSGRKAASSHTGSLGGEDDIYSAALRESGIIRVDDMNELIQTLRLVRKQPLPQGKNLLVVTNAGGKGVMAADACGTSCLELCDLQEETVSKLREDFPEGVSLENPLDIRGDADADRYEEAVRSGLEDSNVDSVLVLLTRQAGTKPSDVKNRLSELKGENDKPILASFFGDGEVEEAVSELESEGIPHFSSPQSAVHALEKALQYNNWKEKNTGNTKDLLTDEEVSSEVRRLTRTSGNKIGGKKALNLIGSCGIDTVENYVVSSISQAKEAAERADGKVAMKVESPDAYHKSDIGGVRLDVFPKEVEDAYRDLMQLAEEENLSDMSVSIQPMVENDRKIIVGAFRHEDFGPMVRFGLGGKYVEVFEDFSTRIAPVTKEEALEMIKSTDYASEILEGVRGDEKSAVDSVSEAVVRVSELIAHFPTIQEVEINPLLVKGERATAVDARVKTEE